MANVEFAVTQQWYRLSANKPNRYAILMKPFYVRVPRRSRRGAFVVQELRSRYGYFLPFLRVFVEYIRGVRCTRCVITIHDVLALHHKADWWCWPIYGSLRNPIASPIIISLYDIQLWQPQTDVHAIIQS